MSDYDRGKYYGKKKFHNDHSSSYTKGYFNNRGGNYTKLEKETKDSKGDASNKMKQPKLLIKTREPTNDTLSPSRKKESESTTSATANQVSTPESTTLPLTKTMTSSVKFLDDPVLLTENVQDYVQENTDFLVVGIVGAQSTGKSTILNLLAHNSLTDELKDALFKRCQLNDEEEYGDNIKILSENLSQTKLNDFNDIKPEIFKIEAVEDIENALHATQGIDLFITSNRVILLDCQPFLSASVLEDLMQNENKRSNLVSEFIPLENSGEINGLQLTAFLMCVCHVLIVVQDWIFDSNIIRFIQTAEMLKPTNSNPEDDFNDHLPHLLLLHNRAQMGDFSPKKFTDIQTIYRKLFGRSKLQIESNLGLGSGHLISYLNPENCGNPINLFLLPEVDLDSNNIYNGYPPLEDLVKKLRSNILGATKFPLTHIQLTEKTWLSYCSKVWDNVKKSSFFVEYTKLMP